MWFRPAVPALLVLVALAGSPRPASAQRQRFKVGGGAGFASLASPDTTLGWTFGVSGFFGYRVNDNVSLESGFSFGRSNRTFNEDGIPVDETPDLPAFEVQEVRYHFDGSFVYNIGRRQPFHPFVLAGGSMVLRDRRQTDFTFVTNPETGEIVLPAMLESSEVVLDESNYEPAAHVGIGAEIYFMFNLAARAEYRLWIPATWENRTQMFLFSASFFF